MSMFIPHYPSVPSSICDRLKTRSCAGSKFQFDWIFPQQRSSSMIIMQFYQQFRWVTPDCYVHVKQCGWYIISLDTHFQITAHRCVHAVIICWATKQRGENKLPIMSPPDNEACFMWLSDRTCRFTVIKHYQGYCII